MWLSKINKKILLLTRSETREDIPFRAFSRRVLFIAYTVIIGIFYSITNILIASVSYNNWIGFVINLDFIAICIISLYLLLNKKVQAGKTVFIIGAILSYFLYANTNTYNSGMQYGWFMILFLIFTSYSVVEKKPLIICLIGLALGIVISEIADYELISTSTLSLGGVKFHNTAFLIANLVLTAIFLFFLSSNFYYSSKEKDKTNEFLTVQTQKLLKANKELDKFVYHAAHDIRAPLTSMLGLIDLGKNEKDLKRINHFFELQEKTIHQLDSYVEQILSVSRVKHNLANAELINFEELEKLLRNQSQFLFRANEMNINFKIEHKGDFFSNKLTLQTIINNLLSNSIKYADKDKKESFVDVVFSNSTKFKNGLKAEVLDNGIGIHNQDIGKITNIFFYNKVMNKGTGYGLYIVKEAVDNLKGDIKFESELGSHTHVTIDLPNMIDNV